MRVPKSWLVVLAACVGCGGKPNPPSAPDATPVLVPPDGSPTPMPRPQSRDKIPYRGQYASAWIAGLHDASPDTRELAVAALLEIGAEDGQIVPAALADLESGSRPAFRQNAIRLLADLGKGDSRSIPALVKALEDKELRLPAVAALGGYGRSADAAVPALIDRLRDESLIVRQAAVRAVRAIRPDGSKSLPASCTAALVRAIDSSDGEVKLAAIDLVTQIGPGAEAAIPSLIRELGDDDHAPTEAACRALLAVGPAAVDPLVGAVRQPKRQAAVFSALRANGAAAVPVLAGLVQDKNADIATAAVRVLGEIGPAAKDALLVVLASPDKSAGKVYYMEAAQTVRRIGAAGVPVIVAALKDDLSPNRGHTAWWIRLSEMNDDVLIAFADALKRTPDTLLESVHGIFLFHPAVLRYGDTAGTRAFVAALVGLLHDPRPETRRLAASAVSDVGLLSDGDDRLKPLRAAIAGLMLDSDSQVRKSAITTILNGVGQAGPPAQLAEILPVSLVGMAHQDKAVRAETVGWLHHVVLQSQHSRGGVAEEDWKPVLDHVSKSHADAFKGMLNERDEELRASAAEILVMLDPTDAVALKVLAQGAAKRFGWDLSAPGGADVYMRLAKEHSARVEHLGKLRTADAPNKADIDNEQAGIDWIRKRFAVLRSAANTAVPTLVDLLDRKRDYSAARLLASIGPAAKEALPALKKAAAVLTDARGTVPAGYARAKGDLDFVNDAITEIGH